MDLAYELCFRKDVEQGTSRYNKAKDIIIKCTQRRYRSYADEVFAILIKDVNSTDEMTRQKAEDLINPLIEVQTSPERAETLVIEV